MSNQKSFLDNKPSESCRVIDFTSANVFPGFISGTWFLTVGGTKMYSNMEITLSPYFYPKQPEYWGIEVIGCVHGIGLPYQLPYAVTLEITYIRGSKGVEVIGTTNQQKLDS